jgi:hypothetical protein
LRNPSGTLETLIRKSKATEDYMDLSRTNEQILPNEISGDDLWAGNLKEMLKPPSKQQIVEVPTSI